MFNYLATIGSTVSWICIDIKICISVVIVLIVTVKHKF
jgi:hypothetical protein